MKINWKKIVDEAKKKHGRGAITKMCRNAGITTAYFYASRKRDTLSFDKLFAIANNLNLHPGQLLVSEINNNQLNETNEPITNYEKTLPKHITDGDLLIELRKDIQKIQIQLNKLETKLSEIS